MLPSAQMATQNALDAEMHPPAPDMIGDSVLERIAANRSLDVNNLDSQIQQLERSLSAGAGNTHGIHADEKGGHLGGEDGHADSQFEDGHHNDETQWKKSENTSANAVSAFSPPDS